MAYPYSGIQYRLKEKWGSSLYNEIDFLDILVN